MLGGSSRCSSKPMGCPGPGRRAPGVPPWQNCSWFFFPAEGQPRGSHPWQERKTFSIPFACGAEPRWADPASPSAHASVESGTHLGTNSLHATQKRAFQPGCVHSDCAFALAPLLVVQSSRADPGIPVEPTPQWNLEPTWGPTPCTPSSGQQTSPPPSFGPKRHPSEEGVPALEVPIQTIIESACTPKWTRVPGALTAIASHASRGLRTGRRCS